MCPECGAPAVDGLSCFEQLGMVLSWEGEDAALAALHFFTVACYNLQHPAQFTEPALEGLRALFLEALDEGLDAPEIRRRAVANQFGHSKVLRPEAERRPVLHTWPMTLADVYANGDPTGAAGRVLAWAQSIRRSTR